MMTGSPPDVLELAARLRLATARLARQLRQQAGAGLSPSLQSALVTIDAHGPVTLGRLAKIEQVAPPTVTRVVARLEDDGLVARTVDDTDRRIVRVSITAAGRRRLEHTRSRRNAWLARRLRTFDAEQRRHLEAALPLLEALAAAPEAPGPVPARTVTAVKAAATAKAAKTAKTVTTGAGDAQGRQGRQRREEGETVAPETRR